MQLGDFSYNLPSNLIAESPPAARTDSRLLSLNITDGSIEHGRFPDILNYLKADDLLVFNDTRVIPARLFGQKQSGGRVEILIERLHSETTALVQLRANKPLKIGTKILLSKDSVSEGDGDIYVEVKDRQNEFFLLGSAPKFKLGELIERFGHMPLPPYIKRADTALDHERYQTVFARNSGAVAAPTAGLHFDNALLTAIRSRGIETAFLTLHVGAGTFQPVRTNLIQDHKMHSEWIEVDEDLCDAVRRCRRRSGRIIAVGTTSVRSLETAATSDSIEPFRGETDIFIYPGYEFRSVDAMITNFHLPESSLLMLVSAFASKNMLLDAYQEAIDKNYRFFSYGDAMFLHRGME